MSTLMVGIFWFQRATTLSMPGTVFQYWRVTLPWAGSQAAATPTTASTAPATRMRGVNEIMASFRTAAGGGGRLVDVSALGAVAELAHHIFKLLATFPTHKETAGRGCSALTRPRAAARTAG